MPSRTSYSSGYRPTTTDSNQSRAHSCTEQNFTLVRDRREDLKQSTHHQGMACQEASLPGPPRVRITPRYPPPGNQQLTHHGAAGCQAERAPRKAHRTSRRQVRTPRHRVHLRFCGRRTGPSVESVRRHPSQVEAPDGERRRDGMPQRRAARARQSSRTESPSLLGTLPADLGEIPLPTGELPKVAGPDWPREVERVRRRSGK